MWVCKEWHPKVIMGLLFSFAIFVIVVVVFFFWLASGCEVYCCWSEELGSGLGNASSVKEEFGGATGCVDGCGYVSVCMGKMQCWLVVAL